MTADQLTAFKANGGISPAELETFLQSLLFAVLLLWAVWALRTAYTGWAEQRINQRQLLGVAVRIVVLYLVLTLLLLS